MILNCNYSFLHSYCRVYLEGVMTNPRSPGKRVYDDGCAAAHALDLVGERWALLVVRELLYGPRRFSDLRESLPAISPNVLSQRLKDLEGVGVIHRYQLPPPAASWVYELTEWGQELEGVLASLRRWGMHSPTFPRRAPISPSTGLSALKARFSPQAAGDMDATIALTLGRDPFTVRVKDGQLDIERGKPRQPGASLSGQTSDLRDVIFFGVPLAQMEENGKVTVQGERSLVEKFLTLFPVNSPEP